MFNFALATAIITFIIGWPVSIYLFFAASFHREKVSSEQEEKN